MDRKTAQQIINNIRAYVGGSSDRIKEHWYVGITANPADRLFSEHGVKKEETYKWVCYQAVSDEDARIAEKELLRFGYDGGTGGGDKPTFVYAFHKESYTDPSNK